MGLEPMRSIETFSSKDGPRSVGLEPMRSIETFSGKDAPRSVGLEPMRWDQWQAFTHVVVGWSMIANLEPVASLVHISSFL